MKCHVRGYTWGLFLCFSEAVSFSSGLSGMSLKEEQYRQFMKGVMSLSVCPLDMGRANSVVCVEHELGGDRAVIIVSALVAILSSSSSVSKDYIGTEECLCRDNLYFCAPEAVTTAKWRDVLEREQFSSRIVAISVDEAHCVSKW